ncbi:hypothetical protein PG985_006303 [Apiospora marii]|uniref:Uncharacterized protein n=1 Tax=Apiospora marii TaxID=335849 RepID=A0ABR1S794_9PEZI
MASIHQAILETAARTSELWIQIAQTDYAPSALEQQGHCVVELSEALAKTAAQIKALDENRGTTLRSHQRYRDSIVRRLAYRAACQRNKYQVKAASIAQEYYEVLQQEHRAKEKKLVLERQCRDALTLHENLESIASQHTQAQAELDHLWERVFSRGGSRYQHERALQQKVGSAQETHRQVLERREESRNTVEALAGALSRIAAAFEEVKKALLQGQMSGDGAETRFLQKAQSEVDSAHCLLRQAKCGEEPSSAIERLRMPSRSDKGAQWDGPYSKILWRDRIKIARKELETCHTVIKRSLEMARTQQGSADLAVHMSEEALRSSKENLRMARAGIYLEVAGNEALSMAQLEDISRGSSPMFAAPPPYLTA